MTRPSEHVFAEVAAKIGCDLAAIRAVFKVEAAGKFFNSDGSLVRRFEPHHFPQRHWATIGFNPKSVKPWKASLRLSTSKRRAMFKKAFEIDRESAMRAASWGAPQIMGFNYLWCGYGSATALVESFKDADEQVRAFGDFVISKKLDSAIRSHDWLTFATGYNGSGQARAYAAKIESAYRKASGKPSDEVLREGSKGDSVYALQVRLVELGLLDSADADFGPLTYSAVIRFQAAHNLKTDGVVGAKTWAALRCAVPEASAEPEPQEAEGDKSIEAVAKYLAPTAGGGVAGRFLSDLGTTAELVIVGGVVAGGLVVLAVWALPKLRRAT